MKTKVIKLSAVAAALTFAGAQVAQAEQIGRPVTQFPGLSSGLIADIGGAGGVENVVDNLFEIVAGDNRINTVLLVRKADPKLQAAQKQALIQTLQGTPSLAEGTRRSGTMVLTVTQYNALAEDLYLALEQARVPYHTSNRVLGQVIAYEPSLVSAYFTSSPSIDGGDVLVGPVQPQ